MTEVLSAPGDGASYFSSSPIHRSSRSSSPQIPSSNTSKRHLKSAIPKVSYDHSEYGSELNTPDPSSAPSSPQLVHSIFSRAASYTSTPASSLSLDCNLHGETQQDIQFPSYEKSEPLYQVDEVREAQPSMQKEPPQEASVANEDEPSDPPRRGLDDQDIEAEPERHVDYLAHNWRLEDIWASWRYVVARRRVYSNSIRLENAAWRTWGKAHNRLRTVTPESLNWLKDCDVTWLYGPLATHNTTSFTAAPSPPPSRLSTSSSFLHKKPILKKKSKSETILQRSISEHSLLKQAGAILKSQEATPARSRPAFARGASEFIPRTVTPASVANTPANEEAPVLNSESSSSASSSGLQSPSNERKRIHFNNEVVQCIALDHKDDEDDEVGQSSETLLSDEEDEDEDEDELVMMKPTNSKGKVSNRSTPRGSFSEASKTIAPLPSTTLRYRSDTPEPPETQQQPAGLWGLGNRLTSPSQETIRPSRPNTNFLIDDDDDYPELQWQPTGNNVNNLNQPLTSPYHTDTGVHEECQPGPGMRRTPSGMFMPYEDNEDEAAMNAGLFGRVVDTVNTARDIAHVIWNVGWRR